MGAPQDEKPIILILKQSQNHDTEKQEYSFSYETENGISVSESGVQKQIGDKPEEAGTVSKGQFSYPEGSVTYTVSWVADENGFHHMNLSFFITISHEKSHEDLTLLLCHHIDNKEECEAAHRFSDHESSALCFLLVGHLLAHASHDKETKSHRHSEHSNIFQGVIQFKLV